MKKSLTLLLLFVLVLLFVSCGGQNVDAVPESDAEPSTDETAEQTDAETFPETEKIDIESLVPEHADTIRYYDAMVGYDFVVVGKDGKYGVMDYDGDLVTKMRFYSMDIEPVDADGNETKLYGYCGCVTEFWIEKDGSETEKGPGEMILAEGADFYWMDGAPVMLDWDEGYVDFSYERATSYNISKKVLGMYTNKFADVIPVRAISSFTEVKDADAVQKCSIYFSSDQFALLDLRTGQLVTDFIFDGYGALGFIEGVLPVRKDGKWGYVDMTGKMLTDFIYDETQSADLSDGEEEGAEGMMYSALNGYIVVRIGDKWGLIDTDGRTIFDVEYEGFSQADRSGRIWIKQDGSWHLEKLWDE